VTSADDRARAALRRAVLAAEGREPGTPDAAALPGAEDYAALKGGEVRREVEAILMAPSPMPGLQRLHEERALAVVLPEVAALVGFGEGARHKDVWEHTKRVVAQSPARTVVRWAALLHDIGKVPTRRIEPDGQIQFHGHAEVGARMVARILRRLEFGPDEARRVHLLVLSHQRPSQYDPAWTDSAVRRFGLETREVLDDLLDLSRADMTTRYEGKRKRGHDLIDELAGRSARIRELDARVPPLPKGLGLAIIERFGLAPGPRVGELRAMVETAVDRGELEPQQDAEVYLRWLEAHAEPSPEPSPGGRGPG
jgi:poly(A) polymerase